MCGIAGCFRTGNRDKVNMELLRRMSSKIAHRGPDGEGYQILNDGNIGMAHRRLAIIDLTPEANQPMCDNEGSIWVVFNGEIYNHANLKNKLNRKEKISWKTDHSDTEVIIYAYKHWGIKCIRHFRGMFAFALWDSREEKLYLVRDRLGIKPLYYGITVSGVNFASNVAALLEDDMQDKVIDEKSVFDFLSLLAVPAPNTLFKKIKKVQAGHYLEICEKREIKDHTYWDPCDYLRHSNLKDGIKTVKDDLLKKLKVATELRKISDVPIGVFLSGGVDSSTNLALFSRNEKEVNTFTVGYKKTRTYKNENKYARDMAEYCHAVHHDSILGEEDIMEFMELFKKICDDPVADPVIISQYYIARLAIKNGIKVVQVGEGADELFAGYTYWKKQAAYEKINTLIPRKIKKKMYSIALKKNNISQANKEFLRRAAEGEGIFWGSGTVYVSEERKKILFNRQFLQKVGNHKTWDNFMDVYMKCKSRMLKDTVGWMACVNFQFRLPELLLARTDKACMAVGLEARVPFLDHKMVEWGLSVPEKMKIKGDCHKYVLKEAVRGIIPDEVIDRKKVGFGLPYMDWYKGTLGRLMNEKVDRFVLDSGFFDRNEVRRFMRDKDVDPIGIWALFVLSLWWEEYGSVSKKEVSP